MYPPSTLDAVPSPPPRPPRPPRLWWAVTAVALEGGALLGFGVWLLIETQIADASNEDVAAGSTAYFIMLGLLALFVAWTLWRQRSWAFGASLFLQILALPIAFSMVSAGFWPGGVALLAVAAVGFAGLFSQPTRSAFGR
jgi:hypothetical protein